MGIFQHFCIYQGILPSLTEEKSQCGSKKEELDDFRRKYECQGGCIVTKMWECDWWTLDKTKNYAKQLIRENFLLRRSLAAEQSIEEIKKEKLSGCVFCDIKVLEILSTNFANFSFLCRKTLMSKIDTGIF